MGRSMLKSKVIALNRAGGHWRVEGRESGALKRMAEVHFGLYLILVVIHRQALAVVRVLHVQPATSFQ